MSKFLYILIYLIIYKILTFEHVPTKISIDLCINNILGVINSNLLKTYSLIDIRCKQLGKLVKIWAKKY